MARLSSFMYFRKSSGPNADPFETPIVIVDIFELKPLMKADCLQSVKQDSNHLFDIPRTH